MRNLEPITLWHREWDPDAGVDDWTPTTQYGHWYLHTLTNVQNGGLAYAREAKIRIPTDADLSVKEGDIMARGEHRGETPPKTGTLTVIGYSDNRKGRSPHWLVMCK